MRISTSTMYTNSVTRMNDNQSQLAKIQQQMSSGLRILSPADDPLGAAKALDLTQGMAINAQNADSRISAKNALSVQEGVLQSATELILDVRSKVVAAGNGTLSDADRKAFATEMRSRLGELTGLANSTDGAGNYLFGGFKDDAAPFSVSSSVVSYNGDSSQKLLQIGSARQLASNDPGDAVFMNVPAKSVFQGSTTGTGGATLSGITITDKSQAKAGHQYAVAFDNGGTTFTMFDVTSDPGKNSPIASGSYVSGQPIQAAGMEMTIAGTATDGDTVGISPVRNQSMFKTLDDMINLLETPVSGTTDGAAKLKYGLQLAGENMDSALDHILSVRAGTGARLQEIDALDEEGAARAVNYADQLSGIQDLDYVKAISDLTQKQTILQASQQSFAKISGLSLFNYL
jgi:flagellar hook-associated protein 3 FlgL